MIVVQLEQQQWNAVLAIIARAPWQEANPLIMAIGEQLRQAQGAAQEPRQRPNGPDEGAIDLTAAERRQRPS